MDPPGSSETVRRTLKGAVGGRFKIGVGHDVLQDPEDAALIKQHFEILTPENCMKPQGIHPAEDEWNYDATDRFTDFAWLCGSGRRSALTKLQGG